MISLIEAKNFRCLRSIHQPLSHFHVLVGPNASGKTTFLDVVAFLGRLVSDGLDAALQERTRNFQDLLWNRSGESFELAIEARIPEDRRALLANKQFDTIRYEIAIGESGSGEIAILAESAWLKTATTAAESGAKPQEDILSHLQKSLESPSPHIVLCKTKAGDLFRTETIQANQVNQQVPSIMSLKLSSKKSALGNLPADESIFPGSVWLKAMLTEGIQQFVLNSLLIRQASPPGQMRGFKPDGSNLPWVIESLKQQAPELFNDWLRHIQTALPDIENLRTVLREDDRHRYLVLEYRGGLSVPSWMVSDGTLRLLALTLPAYLPDFSGICLIEEPENGIHPLAVETVFQSLSSVYGAQILLATHSPAILSMAGVDKVLCFTKSADGATRIIPGNEHPVLQHWKGEANLGSLFAAGVLE